MEDHVIRIRPYDIHDDEDTTVAMFLRQMSEGILNHITLRGFKEITKVSYTTSAEECKMNTFDPITGKHQVDDKNYLIETDGCALAKVFTV